MIFSFRKNATDSIPDAPKETLTIVIPSKDRPAPLAALLGYFNEARVQYQILLLLTGPRAQGLPGHYPNLDLKVVEFGADVNLFDKMKKGLSMVETPLVAMCPDDDIVLHEGLKKSGGFLMQNPDYSACQGYHALFSQNADIVNLASIAYFTPSLDADDPLARINSLMRRYQPICWAMFRTDVMRKIANSFSPELSFLFQEFTWSGIATVMGKVKRLPLLYCLRRIDRMHLTGHPLFSVMESPQTFFSEYLVYRNKLVELLPPAVKRTHAERVIDLIHAAYFSWTTVPNTINFFVDRVLAHPSTSIHDKDIDAALRPPDPKLDKGWSKTETRDGKTYRLFPEFLKPEPKSEIHLPSNFARPLLDEIHPYFTGKAA